METVWQKELLKKFPQLKMEIVKESPSSPIDALQTILQGRSPRSKDLYVLVLPQTPDTKTQKAIRALVPAEIEYRYLESAKGSTIETIKFTCQQQGIVNANSKVDEETRHLTLWLTSPEAEETSEFWGLLSQAFYDDGYFKTWEINVNNGKMKRFFNRKVIDETANRKVGIEPITAETIMDLQIALQTTGDVNDFIALLEGGKR